MCGFLSKRLLSAFICFPELIDKPAGNYYGCQHHKLCNLISIHKLYFISRDKINKTDKYRRDYCRYGISFIYAHFYFPLFTNINIEIKKNMAINTENTTTLLTPPKVCPETYGPITPAANQAIDRFPQ